MLSSVLTYLPNARGFEIATEVSVAIARHAAARVRGLTVIDTRAAETACLSESAAGALSSCRSLSDSLRRSEVAHARLAMACQRGCVPCDARLLRGDPRELLPRESQLHDLVVVGLDADPVDAFAEDRVDFDDLADLVQRGAGPMLMVRPQRRLPSRVLLIYDGSRSSAQAIRTFLNLAILPDAECRLLAVGTTTAAARRLFHEMEELCRTRRPEMETGWTAGVARHTASHYAKKWQADLAVMGLPKGSRYLRWLWGAPAALARRNPQCALFVAC